MNTIPLNTPVGNSELSAWQPVPGITWVQTRNPKHAGRMAQRQDSRLVATGVSGGYLRTFEFRHPISWAQRLICRYTSNGTSPNERLDGLDCPKGGAQKV